MTIFLYLTILVGITLIGDSFTKKYSIKHTFYTDLMYFLNTLENQIKFTKSSIKKIVAENLNSYSTILKDILSQHFIENKNVQYNEIFDAKEIQLINNFLNSVGKLDVQGEIANINNYKTEISRYLIKSKEDYDKYGKVGLKLGFITGLLVCIVLL